MEFYGLVQDSVDVSLSGTVPPADVVMANGILQALHTAEPRVGWHVDIQSDVLTIHSGLHDTFSYRMILRNITKGGKNLHHIAHEMVERIRAGAC